MSSSYQDLDHQNHLHPRSACEQITRKGIYRRGIPMTLLLILLCHLWSCPYLQSLSVIVLNLLLEKVEIALLVKRSILFITQQRLVRGGGNAHKHKGKHTTLSLQTCNEYINTRTPHTLFFKSETARD